jgi:hypothetical protein
LPDLVCPYSVSSWSGGRRDGRLSGFSPLELSPMRSAFGNDSQPRSVAVFGATRRRFFSGPACPLASPTFSRGVVDLRVPAGWGTLFLSPFPDRLR